MHKHGWKIGDTITLRSTDADHMEMTFIIIGKMVSKRYPNTFLMRPRLHDGGAQGARTAG